MIRILDLSKCSHIETQLIDIWQEAFGDSEEYIRNFIKKVGAYSKVVLCEIEERVVSATYLLPVSYLENDGNRLACYYLYAAATLETYRGRGCFAEILQFLNEHIKEPVILVPASYKLVEYYKGHGFYVWLTEKQDAISKLENAVAETISKEAYCKFRKEILNKPYSMLWDDSMMDYICEEHEKAGGYFAKMDVNGTSLLFMCIGNEKDWNVPEILSCDERFRVRPTVMANKAFFVPEKGYFNLSMG